MRLSINVDYLEIKVKLYTSFLTKFQAAKNVGVQTLINKLVGNETRNNFKRFRLISIIFLILGLYSTHQMKAINKKVEVQGKY